MQKVSTYVGATWSCPGRTLKPDHIMRDLLSTEQFHHLLNLIKIDKGSYCTGLLIMPCKDLLPPPPQNIVQYTLIFMDQNLTSYSHAILKSCGTSGICQ